MYLPAAKPVALNPPAATPHARIEKAARELETQFAQMLIKSMRSASMGDPMMGQDSTYRDMYDQQLSRELSKGRGLGLAPMIMRQLERSTSTQSTPGTAPGAAIPLRQPGSSLPGGLPLTLPTRGIPLSGLPSSRLASPIPATLPLATTSTGVSMPAFDVPAFNVSAASMATIAGQTDHACSTDAPLDCSSPEAFVKSIWPQAQKIAAQLGVPAKALVAQVALETGWGRRLVGRKDVTSHNLFGIKAGGKWVGERITAATHEFVDGVRRTERAAFRAYASAADSFADYARLLGKERYAAVRSAGNDVHRFASALQKAGYATDPNYAAKITAIANGPTLSRALSSLAGVTSVAANATASAALPPATKG